MCNKFTRWMKSYTGTLTGSKTSDKVDKDIKRMLERGELLTLEEFYEKWHEWLTTVYMHTEHSGLKKIGETYKKPYDCFMNEDRYFKAAPPKSYATMLMMKSENVLVRNIGITKWGYEYRSDELCDYIGRKVDIKYDPDDMAVLYVFDQKGKRICEAYCQELLQIAPKVTQKALEEHLKMQKRQQKRDRERLEEARRPFEELNEQYVGFSETTGGIELMIGGKKQEKAKNGSVAQSVLDMIPLYLSEGEAENIRGDIAFAQSCLETGNFTFSGSAVELSQNNFCGMGVTQNGETGNSFKERVERIQLKGACREV